MLRGSEGSPRGCGHLGRLPAGDGTPRGWVGLRGCGGRGSEGHSREEEEAEEREEKIQPSHPCLILGC